MIKFSFPTLKVISEDLKNKVINNRIANITFINSRDLLLSFTTYRKEKLLVSLNHNVPFVSFVNIEESISTLVGTANDTLRKTIRDGLIKNIELVNEDRILKITIEKSNDFFEKEVKFLIIELIPHRPNLLLLDEQNTVLFAVHYSSLQDKYSVLKGLKYTPINKSNNYTTNEDNTSISEVKVFAEQYLIEAKQKRISEKHQKLFKFISSRIKSLKNKLNVLEEESKKSKENLAYLEIGNTILSLQNDEKELNEYLSSINFSLNDEISLGENANACFKKYKKAKRTIEMNIIEKEKSLEEIAKLTAIQGSLPYLNEEDILELSSELLPHHSQPQNKKPKSNFSFIEVDGIKIYYGKNAKQNDELTFKFANKQYFYLHVKDYHGSHVIIASENPTNKIKTIASEIALLMSGLETGEVYYSKVKDVKKGSNGGQALLSSYTTFVIKTINPETKNMLLKSNL